MDEKFRDYAILKVKSKATINPMNKGKDTDKHRRYVERLKEIALEYKPDGISSSCQCDACNEMRPKHQALQYFIGVGERMTKENIEQVLGKIEMPIDESWCELKETSNPAVVILKNKWTGMIIQAILTSLTGEVINAKQD